MSTRIDINVAGELLRRLAKAAADANRRGLQERERRQKLEAKAKAEREKELKAKGLGPDGKPLGAPPKRYQFREEPAASPWLPQVLGNVGLAWVVSPVTTFFSAQWGWAPPPTTIGDPPPSPMVGDNFPILVGSGDGSTWVSANLSLPGAVDWGAATRTPYTVLQPFSDVRYDVDPVGHYIYAEWRYNDDSYVIRIALPCGNGAAIVIVGARAAGSVYGYGIKAGLSWQGTDGYWRAEVAGRTTDYLTPTSVTVHDYATFVVSQTTCRQIATPAALSSAMATLWPDTTWTSGDPYAGASTLVPDTSGPYWYAGNARRRKLERANETKSIRSWGVSEAARIGNGTVEATTFSPGAFSLLKGYDATFAAFDFASSGPDYATTSANRAALQLLGAPVPTHWTTVDTTEPGLVAFREQYYAGNFGQDRYPEAMFNSDLALINAIKAQTAPVYHRDALPVETPWKPLKTLPLAEGRTLPGGIADPVFNLLLHYDWGEPAYCRAQLLALGFTAEDLTPAEPSP